MTLLELTGQLSKTPIKNRKNINDKENFYTQDAKNWLTGVNTETLPDSITPSKINVLKQNEIFV